MEANAFQVYIDAWTAVERGKWQATQLTLGELIAELERCDAEKRVMVDGTVYSVSNGHSYRGYYADMGLEPSEAEQSVEECLAMLRGCVGASYRGYKGGEYEMGCDAPLWIAYWGFEGSRLLRVDDGGKAVSLVTEGGVEASVEEERARLEELAELNGSDSE